MTDARPLLEVTDLVKHYAVRGGILRRQVGTVHAVDGVSFSLGASTDVRLTEIPGMVPSLTNLPEGCAFAPRSKMAIDRCRSEYPPLETVGENHLAACWRAAETGVPL